MIHLIIKGELEVACNAAKARDIPLASARRHVPLDGVPSFVETLATVDDSYWPDRGKKVLGWFCEPREGAPYPDGTLLFYSSTQNTVG